MSWKYFKGNHPQLQPLEQLSDLPDCPPWREFLPRPLLNEQDDQVYWQQLRALAQDNQRAIRRGQNFRIETKDDGTSEIIDAVNAAIHLRRPLLVTGDPGSGKTSLAYAIAYELNLGPVLTWPITARSNVVDAQYSYDAIARLQDVQLDRMRQFPPIAASSGTPKETPAVYQSQEEEDLGNYIQLGPVGTAFVPSLWPRVLLIDEIDKSDLNLPNDLLNLFEEGEFEIPELVRRKRQKRKTQTLGAAGKSKAKQKKSAANKDATVMVRTADEEIEVPITNGRIKCCEFPIVIMTSNGEREFPPAFHRRCLRVRMPNPTPESLVPIVESHFEKTETEGWKETQPKLAKLIETFVDKGNKADRATDQLLNAIHLMTRDPHQRPDETEMKRLQDLLFKRLSEADR